MDWLPQAGGYVVTLDAAVWPMLTKLQSAQEKIEGHKAVIEERLQTMTQSVSEAREARKNLWQEIRAQEQRLTRLEAQHNAGS